MAIPIQLGLIKRTAARFALALFGIIVSVAMVEVIMAITPLGETSFFTYERDRGWGLKPGARGWWYGEGGADVSINRWGFRGPEVALNKPAGTFRVVVLGDSFTAAQQVPYDETFSAVVQRALTRCLMRGSASPFSGVEVLNLGVHGYGTAQELITLRRQAAQFQPDFAVLAIFTGNDIRNNSAVLEDDKCRPFYVYRDDRLTLGGPFEDSWLFRLGCMARFELYHSQVVNQLAKVRGAIGARPGAARATDSGQPEGVEPFVDDLIYREPQDPVWRDAWRVTEGEIVAVARAAVAAHAGFLAVTLSNGIQVYPDPGRRNRYAAWVGSSNLFYPEERIKLLGERNGFEVLNLAPPMQAYADAHHAFLHGFANTAPGIGHWNALGHRVAGELIAQKICAMVNARRD